MTPWTVSCQALLSMEFSKQEYWGELLLLLQGIFPTQGLNLCLLHWQEVSLTLSHQGNLLSWLLYLYSKSFNAYCESSSFVPFKKNLLGALRPSYFHLSKVFLKSLLGFHWNCIVSITNMERFEVLTQLQLHATMGSQRVGHNWGTSLHFGCLWIKKSTIHIS